MLRCVECGETFALVSMIAGALPASAEQLDALTRDFGCPECWGDLERLGGDDGAHA